MVLLDELSGQDTISIGAISFALGGFLIVAYIVYQRWLHPLAEFPGPFAASLTDLWQVHQVMSLRQPYNLTDLHLKHGPFVRYGPDKLSVTSEDAIQTIYQKGGSRAFPKTEYYNAFGSSHPNVFGVRDQEAHSKRRRHMSHSFSIAYVKEMEQYLDLNVDLLRKKILRHIERDEPFNLTRLVHFYIIDVLGELAFSQSFGVQIADDEALVPPVKEHGLLAAATGSWPSMTMTLKRWLPVVPHAGLQRLFQGRAACARLASRCVARRMSEVQADELNGKEHRKDILTNLIKAKDADTGESLTQADLETEAFGFIIAGTHTTSVSISLVFYHLLHAPDILAKCVDEVRTKLPRLERGEAAYTVAQVEGSLPFLRQCVKESFRVTPVFTMPLPRRVMAPEGVMIGGRHIKQGTSVAVSSDAFHHNPDVWGARHDVFDPYRWEDPDTAARSHLLMHLGMGSRQCVGKTVAMTNIYKVLATLLGEFDFELADGAERAEAAQGEHRGRSPGLVSVGVSDLTEPLTVKAQLRHKA